MTGLARFYLVIGILCVVRLSGQSARIVLPDTTFEAQTARDMERPIEALLAREGGRGRLGAIYTLDHIQWQRADSGATADRFLTITFKGDTLEVLDPDTVLVRDATGRSIPSLVPVMRSGIFAQRGVISDRGSPLWRVNSTGYFQYRTGYGVVYDVTDIARRQAQLLAAYNPSVEGPGSLVGQVILDLPNFIGAFRYLNVDWRRLSSVNQTFSLIYSEPYLPLIPVGARFQLAQDIRDTLYVNRDLRVQLTSLPGQRWNASAGAGVRQFRATLYGQGQGLTSYRQHHLNLLVLGSFLDYPLNPTRGYQAKVDLEGGTINGPDSARESILARTDLMASVVASRGLFTVSVEGRFRGVWGNGYTPQSGDYWRFGGMSSIRGYREDQFLAPWGIESRSELRYRTGANTRLYLLLDAGYLPDVGSLLAGGMGLVLRAGDNLVQLDFAWNRDDNLGSGKVHVRLITLLSGE